MPASGSQFYSALLSGMEEHSVQREGVSLDVRRSGGDGSKQIDHVKRLAASGVVGIIVATSDPSIASAARTIAAQAGIPLVLVGKLFPELDPVPPGQAAVGVDDQAAAQLLGLAVCRRLADLAQSKGAKFAVLRGPGEVAEARLKGLKEALAPPGCKSAAVAYVANALWKREAAKEQITRWLKEDAGIDAVVAQNDLMAAGAVEAYRAKAFPTRPLIAAFVLTQEPARAVSSGGIDVAVDLRPGLQGQWAVYKALQLAGGVYPQVPGGGSGGDCEAEALCVLPPTIVEGPVW